MNSSEIQAAGSMGMNEFPGEDFLREGLFFTR